MIAITKFYGETSETLSVYSVREIRHSEGVWLAVFSLGRRLIVLFVQANTIVPPPYSCASNYDDCGGGGCGRSLLRSLSSLTEPRAPPPPRARTTPDVSPALHHTQRREATAAFRENLITSPVQALVSKYYSTMLVITLLKDVRSPLPLHEPSPTCSPRFSRKTSKLIFLLPSSTITYFV